MNANSTLPELTAAAARIEAFLNRDDISLTKRYDAMFKAQMIASRIREIKAR